MKMKNHKIPFAIATSAMVLAGCTAVGTSYPTLNETTDPYKYVAQYIAADETSLFNPAAVTSMFGIFADRETKKEQDHIKFNRLWCSKEGTGAFIEELDTICRANNGEYSAEDGWCTDVKTKEVVFYARAGFKEKVCTNSPTVVMQSLFPAEGKSYHDPAWQDFVRRYKESLIAMSREREETEALNQKQKEQEELRRKVESEKLLKMPGGSRICRYEPYRISYYSSINEGMLVSTSGRDINDGMVEVQIDTGSGIGGAERLKQIKTITEPISYWHRCEKRKSSFPFFQGYFK